MRQRLFKYAISLTLLVLIYSGWFFVYYYPASAKDMAFNVDNAVEEASSAISNINYGIDNAVVQTSTANIDAAVEQFSSSTSLVAKDTSGVYDEQAGENEMYEERTRTFKKFKQEPLLTICQLF